MGPAGQLWRDTLQQIPTIFGRLAYLSSLRDPRTNRYTHTGLRRWVGMDDADRTLCHCHYQVFSQWIACSLEEQKADLDEYLIAHGSGTDVFHQYRDLVPPTARDVERQLYVTDLETLLQLLEFERAAASPIREASRRR